MGACCPRAMYVAFVETERIERSGLEFSVVAGA